jgi:hypothetical protein
MEPENRERPEETQESCCGSGQAAEPCCCGTPATPSCCGGVAAEPGPASGGAAASCGCGTPPAKPSNLGTLLAVLIVLAAIGVGLYAVFAAPG